MTMFNYESDKLYQQVKGETLPSSPVYVAECKKEIIDEVSPNYPQLVEYEKEWLNFAQHVYHDGTPVPLEYQEVNTCRKATVQNAIPFYYKSAILTGNTLVNCLKPQSGNYIDYQIFSTYKDFTLFKPNTLYTFINNWDKGGTLAISGNNGQITNVNFAKNSSTLFTTPSAITNVEIYSPNGIHGGTPSDCEKWKTAFIVIEGDYTNVDIPYFEGMASVKMPVLTTTGKNLVKDIEDCYKDVVVFKIHPLKNGEDYIYSTINFTMAGGNVTIYSSLTGESYTVQNWGQYITIFTVPNDGITYDRIRLWEGGLVFDENTMSFQIEKGSTATTYEPHKSNILTVNEPFELRKVGNVQDELNLLTGELTQRIGEVTLDGSVDECWVDYNKELDFTIAFFTQCNMLGSSYHIISNSFPSTNKNNLRDLDIEGICTDENSERGFVFLRINKSRLSTPDVNGLIAWLQSNPIIVQYSLETESVKTVELNQIIKPYEGTNHYTVSSETIPPQLCLSVPVVSTGNQTLNDILTEE